METMERKELFEWAKEIYGAEPDYPWNDWNCVLRHKRMLLGSITRNGAVILIEFFLKPFRSLTAICIQYVTIDLRNHVCLRVARISLHRLNVPACQNQLIGDTAVA